MLRKNPREDDPDGKSLVPKPGATSNAADERIRLASILLLPTSDPLVDQFLDAAMTAFRYPDTLWFQEVKWACLKQGYVLSFPNNWQAIAVRSFYLQELLALACGTDAAKDESRAAAIAASALVLLTPELRTAARASMHEAAVTFPDVADLLGDVADFGTTEDATRTIRDALGREAARTEHWDPRASHSEDFSFVNWYGAEYEFNSSQARVIEMLWNEWKRHGLGLNEATIGDRLGSTAEHFRLKHTFRAKGRQHPAWDAMIHRSGSARYRLVPRDPQ